MSYSEKDLAMFEKDIGIIITDTQGRTTWINNFLEEIYGYKLEEVKGIKPKDFLQGEDTESEAIKLMEDKLSKKLKIINLNITNYNKEKKLIYLRLNIYPRYENQKLIGFISYQYNITETVSLLKEKDIINRKLQFENQKKQLLIRLISHDVKNLISTSENITSLSKKFIENGNYPKALKYLEKLYQNNKVTYDYLNSVLKNSDHDNDFQQADQNNYCDVIEIINKCIMIQNSAAFIKKINIKNLVTEKIIIPGKTENLVIIVGNLLNNAIKYSPSNTQIELTCIKKNGQIVIRITDQGLGMSLDFQNILNSGKVDDLTTFGIKNSIELLVKLNGKLNYISQPYISVGTICEIIFQIV